jgi:dTDP-4-amino-4,6-dideoxygalactose transaminase
MIPVTKSFLPPIEEYMTNIQRVYTNEWLTNRGELVQELEQKLIHYLNLKDGNILITNNGTIPLQIALKIFGNGGEIITTPFSYVATTAAIVWENCKPIFVDIHPEYLTIDETKIVAAITDKTTCILATHVFGNPCNIEVIESIAEKHNLKVIYDAAHCFGVEYNGKSIFEYGDISTCSFHATKLFHTGEGGAIFCKEPNLFHEIFYRHNFGHNGPTAFLGLGINGKISELQAAMGLSVLPYMPAILNERKRIVEYYDQNLNFNIVQKLKLRENTKWNFSYYPILFESEKTLLRIQDEMNEHNIYPRRYFYPSLNLLPYVEREQINISENVSQRVMCLPLYFKLEEQSLLNIVELINKTI